MLQRWHIRPAVLKNHCWNVALPFHLWSSVMDRFTNIYAQGTEEHGKQTKKEGVEVSAGESKGKSEVMQVRNKSDEQE